MNQTMSDYIGFRFPDYLVASIKATIEATGQDKTSVIVDMLRSSLPVLPINQRSLLPQESAIYFVWCSSRLLYIGKTKNLRSRINTHQRLMQFLAIEDDVSISWFGADEENLNAFESSLIDELEPEFNGGIITNSDLIQFNVRLDGRRELLDAVKAYVSEHRLTMSEFVATALENALKLELNKESTEDYVISLKHVDPNTIEKLKELHHIFYSVEDNLFMIIEKLQDYHTLLSTSS